MADIRVPSARRSDRVFFCPNLKRQAVLFNLFFSLSLLPMSPFRDSSISLARLEREVRPYGTEYPCTVLQWNGGEQGPRKRYSAYSCLLTIII